MSFVGNGPMFIAKVFSCGMQLPSEMIYGWCFVCVSPVSGYKPEVGVRHAVKAGEDYFVVVPVKVDDDFVGLYKRELFVHGELPVVDAVALARPVGRWHMAPVVVLNGVDASDEGSDCFEHTVLTSCG